MWRKSTFSGNPNSDCVEVSLTGQEAAVRDSKNRTGPVLRLSTPAWRRLITSPPAREPLTY